MAQRATLPMLLALAICLVGFATLIFVQEATSPPLIYGAYYAGTLFALYLLVRLMLPNSDVLILPIVTMLTGIGLMMIFRLTHNVEGVETLAITQAGWILAGSAALFLIVLFLRDYHKLFDYKYILATFAIILICLTFTPLGYEVNGARLWVNIGPVSFQPSEFARIALIVFFAGYLADTRDLLAVTSRTFMGIQIPALKYFGPVALVWAASLALLVFEKDLGSSLLFFIVPLLMLFVATGRVAYLIIGGLMFAVGTFIAYFLFAHFRVRIVAWLDPWQDPDGMGFQILQSIFNISDGGLTGTGLGAGFAQTIPEVQTDFIFSAIASELGLLGATAILLAFLVFVYRGIKIAMLASDDASKLLAYGLTVMFAFQTLTIVGGVIRAIPLTGITLPFVSYGGSSVVGNFIIAGLLLVISEKAGRRERKSASAYSDRDDRQPGGL
ncbi:Bacterial cell division membrane protein [Rubrobacter radiotolerans]|uniref:Bacterial cell division membrane protein n=1 Tax=Rubrobacter radiotolerans TaxID=42256 RepID=A0A023WYZ7_RUBRA|nr:FtsW/RodA/SpoVE family cell cycle protein [Rubrobacter radiotolerans]AHY45308.1 Bacterial cell division membrane protein [Rubrobacter radiotolerans]MDX5892720.1 FtsW/RodA/SpoVE family cell cycle protein [Rubrobacter radiotolerans]SMC02347.1 cell division protein FtsW, lipid II flippase [Rubrobacter radiotolerans DSM 5868]